MASFLPTLISQSQLQKRVAELGKEVDLHYSAVLSPDQNLVVIGVLSGSFIFTADLVRAVQNPCLIDFVQVSSYEGTQSTGKLKFTKDLSIHVRGQHCLIVEDIVDTGLTASALLESLHQKGVASVKLCSLLHKPSRQKIEVPIDFLGFSIEDHFVVGYGLDFDGKLRHLSEIKILNAPEDGE